MLSIHDAACGAETACSDDGCDSGQSDFAGVLGPGTYNVAVKAKQPGATGVAQLKVQRAGCAGAREVAAPGSYAGDTTGTGNVYQPGCGPVSGNDEAWWFKTCPGSTGVRASTCGGGDFDTVVELRGGSCTGTPVVCSDDDPMCVERPRASTVEAALGGDGLWFVVVDGFGSDVGGPYTLDVTY